MANKKEQIITILDRLAKLSQLIDDNPFKIKAYQKAARAIKAFDKDILKAYENGDIKNIPGIGKGVYSIIKNIINNEPVLELERLLTIIPRGVEDLLKIDGLGPKRARLLWQEHSIKNLGELEYAINENRLVNLKGFGNNLLKNIQNALHRYRENQGWFRLDQLHEAFEELSGHFKRVYGISSIHLAGGASRAKECDNELKLVLFCTDSFLKISKDILSSLNGLVSQAKTSNNKLISFNFKNINCYLYCHNDKRSLSAFLLYHTSDEAFFKKLKQKAWEKLFVLSKDGLKQNGKIIETKTIAEIFQYLGIHYVVPEQREKNGILIEKQKKAKRLIEYSDIKGAFHNHTVLSDGKNTLKEMHDMAVSLGLSYLSINDHSKSAFYAHGLDDERLKEQVRSIHTFNEAHKSSCYILSGTESDILRDGSLDYNDDILHELDVVIASIHSRLKQDSKEMTTRLINALQNPYTAILGHPTGRLILDRPQSEFDMSAVIKAAKKNNCVLELNANPHRLDLNEENLRLAKEYGVMIAINADAHSTDGLKDLQYGVMIARRAGLSPNDVLNCLPVDDIKQWLKSKKP